MTFYIIITIVGINIIYAIVIDTFIELREEVKMLSSHILRMYNCVYIWLYNYSGGKQKGTTNKSVLSARNLVLNLKKRPRYVHNDIICTYVLHYIHT